MAAMFDFITAEGLLVVSIESRFDTSRSMQVYSVNSSTNLAWRTKSIHLECFSCSRANYTWREWHFCTISVRVHIGTILYRNDRFPWGMGRGEIATHRVERRGEGEGRKQYSLLFSLCTRCPSPPLDSPNSSTFLEFSVAVTRAKTFAHPKKAPGIESCEFYQL